EEEADAPDVHDHRRHQPENPEAGLTAAHHDVEPAGERPEFRVAQAGGKIVQQRTAGCALHRMPDPVGRAYRLQAHVSAASRSRRRSSSASTPTLRRTRSSAIPIRARFSAGTDACVITAGWL